jgi:hypothetical protein
MTAKAKVVNYTPEMTAEIVETYTAEATRETVEALAAKFGKTARSIVAKLSREGVYKKAEYVGKNGEKPETKEAKVAKIAALVGVPAEKMAGLEAATKVTLDLIVAALTAKVAAPVAEGEGEGEGEGSDAEGNAATA